MKHIMKKAIFLSFLLLLSAHVFSQTINWSNQIGSSSWDYGRGVTDNFGNFYVTGQFQGSKCHLGSTLLSNGGKNSIFFAKYDANGNLLWAQRLGGDNSASYAELQGALIFYDSVNNTLFLTGIFWGNARFGSFLLSAQLTDIFLAKYNLDGICIWAKKYGGIGSDDCIGMASDPNGNIFLCGATSDSAHFSSISIPKGGFLAKLDESGNCIWAKKVTDYEPTFYSKVRFMDMRVFEGSIYIDGCLATDTNIWIDTLFINHPGYKGSILCCFDGSGNIKWVREGISPGTEVISKIGMDTTGNIYFTGTFFPTISFGDSILVTNSGSTDMFLVKYTKDGELLWLKKAGATTASGRDVVCDPAGSVYLTGFFSGFASFDGFGITAFSQKDLFLARYSPNGTCLGVFHTGGCQGICVSQDNEGSAYVVARFMNTITLGSDTLTSYGLDDILLFKTSAITGIEEMRMQNDSRLVIYANPNEGTCRITIPDEFLHEKELALTIFDLHGKVIQRAAVSTKEDRFQVNISAEARGTYPVTLSNGRKNYTGKIIFR
jgi:hypothetical protein